MCCSFTSKSSCVVKSEDGRNFCFFCFFFSEALFVCFFLSPLASLYFYFIAHFVFFTPQRESTFCAILKETLVRSLLRYTHTYRKSESESQRERDKQRAVLVLVLLLIREEWVATRS